MKNSLLLAMALVLLAGCKKEYPFDQEVIPQIVVNAILCPDDPEIRVDLWWSKKLESEAYFWGSDFKRVEHARVTLSENGAVLFETVSGDSQLVWDYRPREGATYTLRVNLENRKEVTATTTVPFKASAECRFLFNRNNLEHSYYNHYRIENIAVSRDAVSALMLMALDYRLDSRDENRYYLDICAMAPFADQFNCTRDNFEASEKGSVDEFYKYMRVSPGNIDRVFPLTFSVRAGFSSITYPEDYWTDPGKYKGVEFPVTVASQRVVLVAASPAYDRYYKTLHQYKEAGGGSGMLTGDLYKVYSNVNNGLGIFASYSPVTFTFDFNPR